MAGPVLAGAVQLTVRLLLDAAVSLGAPGLPGGSSTSATLTVTATVSVPSLPSSAFTVRE